MENINKTSKIQIEISAKNWNCLRLGNSGTSSVRYCCDIWYFYILTSSSASQIFIDSDRDHDHNYSIYDICIYVGWGFFN